MVTVLARDSTLHNCMDQLDKAACWADLKVPVVACHVCVQDHLVRPSRLVCTFSKAQAVSKIACERNKTISVVHDYDEAHFSGLPKVLQLLLQV